MNIFGAGFFNVDGSIRHSGPTHPPTGVPTATLEKIGHVFSNVPDEISVHGGTCNTYCIHVYIIDMPNTVHCI